MRVSVVIPALNEEAGIEECLLSIKAQEIPSEIIVIDNGSIDRTPEIARKYCDKILVEPKMNLAQMRALGVEESTGEIIVTTDADCVAPAQWLTELTKPFQDNNVTAVGGPYKPLNPSILADFFCFLSAKTQLLGFFGGGNMAYKRVAYNQTSGYNDAKRAEDWMLSWNLRATGRTIHAPKAYTLTVVPLNRQLEYPILLISWILLFIGLYQQWYMITGFAFGYIGSMGTTFLFKYRKSFAQTIFAIIVVIIFLLMKEYLVWANNLYLIGGIIGILAYLFVIEYVRMGLEFSRKRLLVK
jgi:glycosyltransferase involved in cell wall biosynthesis